MLVEKLATPSKSGPLFENSFCIIDMTCPLLGSRPETYKMWLTGGAAVATPTIAVNHHCRQAIGEISQWLTFIDNHAEELLLILQAKDVERAQAEGKLGIIFHFQNSLPLERDIGLLRVYHKLGVRIIQLAYNQKNFVGDGCEERTDAGLSHFGIKVIHEMNQLGIIVDLSHTGYTTSLEATEVSRAPVIFSHANAKAVHNSSRNITDEQIKAVARTGGIIGVVGYPAFVSRRSQPTLSDLLAHLDYIVDLVGVDHVGIGIDYFDKMSGIASDDEALEWYNEILADGRWSSETYPPPPWHYPEEISHPSKLKNLVPALLERGYLEEDVVKIVGGNFLRLLREVESIAKS